MDHWILENMFVFILASFSGFDLIRRLAVRTYSVVVSFPLKCYLKVVTAFALKRQNRIRAECSGNLG